MSTALHRVLDETEREVVQTADMNRHSLWRLTEGAGMDAGREAVGGRRSAARHLPLNRALSQLERKVCRLVAGAVARQGLAVDQWRVIDVLADDRGHPMSELAAAVMVPAPTLTKIVDKLVDAALVYRLVDDRDRRRVFAFLSEAGQELYTSLAPEVDALEAKALAGLGDDQFVLRELLARVVARDPAEAASS